MIACLSVCPSIFAPGARTVAPIGTGEDSFDAPERQKDDGGDCGVIGTTWHMPRAMYVAQHSDISRGWDI